MMLRIVMRGFGLPVAQWAEIIQVGFFDSDQALTLKHFPVGRGEERRESGYHVIKLDMIAPACYH